MSDVMQVKMIGSKYNESSSYRKGGDRGRREGGRERTGRGEGGKEGRERRAGEGEGREVYNMEELIKLRDEWLWWGQYRSLWQG